MMMFILVLSSLECLFMFIELMNILCVFIMMVLVCRFMLEDLFVLVVGCFVFGVGCSLYSCMLLCSSGSW